MRIPTPTRLAGTVLAAALLAGASSAEITRPDDRDGKIALMMSRRAFATMKACPGQSPRGTPDEVGGPRAPSTSAFDQAALARFLSTGLQQSYGKTWQQGWEILHTVTKKAIEIGNLPPGVDLTLKSGRDASYEKPFEVAYKVLHEAVKQVAERTGDFAGDSRTAFSAFLRVGRAASYEKSWQHGWQIIHKFADNLEKLAPDLYPSAEVEVAAKAAKAASYEKSFQAAYQVIHTAFKTLETVPTGTLRSFYFRLALECSYEKSWKEGWEILRTFIQKALESGRVDPFDKATLETSLQASYNKPFQAAYEVLRDGLKSLL